MPLIVQLVTHPRGAGLVVMVAGVAALLGAYGSQHFAGLVPCPLCLYQRPPYWLAAPLGLIAYAVPFPRIRRLALALASLALAVGAAIAVFHVGVEQHWWGGLAQCTEIDATEEILRLLEGTELSRCDEIPWTLFGASMAAYNAMLGTGLAGLAAIGAWRPISNHPD